jgi:hypothetical protein
VHLRRDKQYIQRTSHIIKKGGQGALDCGAGLYVKSLRRNPRWGRILW